MENWLLCRDLQTANCRHSREPRKWRISPKRRCRGSCRLAAFAPVRSLFGKLRCKKGKGRWVDHQGTGFCPIVFMTRWPAFYAARGRNYRKRSPIPGLTNFGSAALTHMPRSHWIACNRGSAMTPTPPSPRCSHHVNLRRARCAGGGKDAKRRRVSTPQPPCEPPLPMRRPPHGGTAIRGALAAVA